MCLRSNAPVPFHLFWLRHPCTEEEASEATERCPLKNLLLQTPREFSNIKNVDYSVALLTDS